MKNKIIRILSLNICLLLIVSMNGLAQDESSYRKALSEAFKQSNPSEYRARAFVKYLDGLEGTKMSESKLNQFLADKFTELMETDFYAAFLAQSMTTAAFIKWREVFPLLPAGQVAAIERLGQWKNAKTKISYPPDLPKPGFGWKKTDSNNVRPKNPTEATKSGQSERPRRSFRPMSSRLAPPSKLQVSPLLTPAILFYLPRT